MTGAAHPESLPRAKFAQRVFEPGSITKNDGTQELRRLAKLGYRNESCTHLGSNTLAHVDLPAVQMIASVLERGMLGTMPTDGAYCSTGYPIRQFILVRPGSTGWFGKWPLLLLS